MKKDVVLVIVAHTDDETIGLGGTIVRHKEKGDEIYAIAMTNGVDSRQEKKTNASISRKLASLSAGKRLGLTWLEAGDFPDNSMDTVPLLEVSRFIEKAKLKIRPSIIYTHSSADLNIDHRIVSQASLTAFRPKADDFWREIRAFEVASSTDYGHGSVTNLFYPNLYIDITTTWKVKAKALKEYDKEILEFPNSRSINGLKYLARYRGCQCGLLLAEAFEVIRKIER